MWIDYYEHNDSIHTGGNARGGRNEGLELTQKSFVSKKPANSYVQFTTEQILQDLAESCQQITEGKIRPMKGALDDLEQ